MDDFSCICCVVFDLDDTLWSCEPTIINAEHALYDWMAEHSPRITDQLTFDGIRERRAKFALQNPEISHNVTALRLHSLAELAKTFGYPKDLARDGLAYFRKHRNQVSLFDDALPTIRALAKNFSIGVITNGNADLNAIGIRDNFDFVVTAEDAGAAKPDKEIFDFARIKANVASHELLYVGDHPVNDVIGPINSGWQALWFNPNYEDWPNEWPDDLPDDLPDNWLEECWKDIRPNGQIQKLSELPNLLNR